MKLVLVRKLANEIDGIDLSRSQVGDVLELSRADARLLAAEGWGVMERRRTRRPHSRLSTRRERRVRRRLR